MEQEKIRIDPETIKHARRLTMFRHLLASWDSVNPLITRVSFVQFCQLLDILEPPMEDAKSSRSQDAIQAIESIFILLKFCNLTIVRRSESGRSYYESEMLAGMLTKELKLPETGTKRLKGLFSYYIATSENRLHDTLLRGQFVPSSTVIEIAQSVLEEIQMRVIMKGIRKETAHEILKVTEAFLKPVTTPNGKLLQVAISDQCNCLDKKVKQVGFKLF